MHNDHLDFRLKKKGIKEGKINTKIRKLRSSSSTKINEYFIVMDSKNREQNSRTNALLETEITGEIFYISRG
jgi:hypothetical protein